ncbi:uncharacterized protein LOC123880039 [Maniola jurtina]|uniref:uncharacterized protein LOC123880039 n=1 Tax=Maniola jurtina TaxID=191418 RepID=UPI001E68A780|nr:uncharacterized protein LOC123880039 [Maniola jurtina]
MVVCDLDKEVSGEILGWKLPAWQALLLHRVMPSCGGLIIYLIVVCYDLALIYEQFQNKDNALAIFCLILMVLPALLSLMFTLASPPPGLQTDLSAFNVNIQKNDVIWIAQEFFSALFFPIAAIGRYCYLIFWWVEAVCASRAQDETRTREAISRARAPSSMELYLFLQAFIHCAPHAVINILDMLARYANPDFDKLNLQAISLIASCLRMASTATMYRRFEREKLCGRKYPWGNKVENQDRNIDEENDGQTNNNDQSRASYEPIIKGQSFTSQKTLDNREQANSDLIQFSPRSSEIQEPFYDDYIDSDSDLSLDDLPPEARNENYDSDDEYVRPISIIDRVAPRRRDTQYTIETVDVPPPPAVPAPRPGSFAVWAEKLVENAESIPTWLSAPPRRKHWEVIQDEPDIPRRVPRSYLRGLLPQDATGALVNFLGWYSFFVARLISIAAFISFFPFLAILILMSHYQVMLLFLIVPQASTVKRAFYVFLAFIYLFCLMEFKIRFRHVRVWHVFWIIVCTVEIVIFISLWATIDNNLHSWWKGFIVIVTIGSMMLSYMLFLVYFLLLQPRETVVHLNRVVKK